MKLLNLIFPPKCIFCGKPQPLFAPHDEPCAACLSELPLMKEPRATGVAGFTCVAPLKYTGVVVQGLRGLKFGRRAAGVRYFARLCVQALKRYDLRDFDRVTWVPVSLARQRRRGYDQSELIAREIAKLLGVKTRRLLIKVRHTKPNSLLKTENERRENVAGAFRRVPFVKSVDKILLVDDIVTTGSTLTECAALLADGGAAEVAAVTVASARN